MQLTHFLHLLLLTLLSSDSVHARVPRQDELQVRIPEQPRGLFRKILAIFEKRQTTVCTQDAIANFISTYTPAIAACSKLMQSPNATVTATVQTTSHVFLHFQGNT